MVMQCIIVGFPLQGAESPQEFVAELVHEGDVYNGFNLIIADFCSMSMLYITNRPKGDGISVSEVSPGVHLLTNARLDTPWNKVSSFLVLQFKVH